MYNVHTAIGRPNETIYYGRAGSVLKKEKNIVIVIYGLYRNQSDYVIMLTETGKLRLSGRFKRPGFRKPSRGLFSF